jgi:hypothetical protein
MRASYSNPSLAQERSNTAGKQASHERISLIAVGKQRATGRHQVHQLADRPSRSVSEQSVGAVIPRRARSPLCG